LASCSSFFLHRSKFKSQNHKMVIFIKLVFRHHHPASCSRGRHQASCSATLWPVTIQPQYSSMDQTSVDQSFDLFNNSLWLQFLKG
jgi:hypothetical protein